MFRDRWDEFVFRALSGAAGTVIGAAIIFLVGVAAGQISDVPVSTWLSVGAGLIGVLSALLLGVFHGQRAGRLDFREMEAFLDAMTEEERAAIAREIGSIGSDPTEAEQNRVFRVLKRAVKQKKESAEG